MLPTGLSLDEIVEAWEEATKDYLPAKLLQFHTAEYLVKLFKHNERLVQNYIWVDEVLEAIKEHEDYEAEEEA